MAPRRGSPLAGRARAARHVRAARGVRRRAPARPLRTGAAARRAHERRRRQRPRVLARRRRLPRLLDGRCSTGRRAGSALVFVLLAGIVFFNVDLLQMNREIAATPSVRPR